MWKSSQKYRRRREETRIRVSLLRIKVRCTFVATSRVTSACFLCISRSAPEKWSILPLTAISDQRQEAQNRTWSRRNHRRRRRRDRRSGKCGEGKTDLPPSETRAPKKSDFPEGFFASALPRQGPRVEERYARKECTSEERAMFSSRCKLFALFPVQPEVREMVRRWSRSGRPLPQKELSLSLPLPLPLSLSPSLRLPITACLSCPLLSARSACLNGYLRIRLFLLVLDGRTIDADTFVNSKVGPFTEETLLSVKR